jgi:hypothetical protein
MHCHSPQRVADVELCVPRISSAALTSMVALPAVRFVFLLVTRVAAGLRLSRRAEAWKAAEILILWGSITRSRLASGVGWDHP